MREGRREERNRVKEEGRKQIKGKEGRNRVRGKRGSELREGSEEATEGKRVK